MENKPNNPGRPFQVKPKIRRPLKQEKRKIVERLEPFIGGTDPRQEGRPEFSGPCPTTRCPSAFARCHTAASPPSTSGCGKLGCQR